MNQETLRGKLEAASKTRGLIARIAKEAKVDPRTVRAVLNSKHAANIDTLDKLDAYFRKADRKAKPVGGAQ